MVRRATVEDTPALARHRALMFRELQRITDADVQPVIDATRAFLAHAIPAGIYAAWVASPVGDAATIVAGAGAQRRVILPRPDARLPFAIIAEEALILNVFTDTPWRRLGIAEQLMRAVLAWTEAEGIRRVVLHASAAGRPLYERLGFASTNEMIWHGYPAPDPGPAAGGG
jgi:GNAT superfamily N-acetyltransferase